MAKHISAAYQPLLARIGRATKANRELAMMLAATEWPTITDYELFRKVQVLYESGKKLNLRHHHATTRDYKRLHQQLRNLGVLASDPDYGKSAYRILSNPDRPAEEICCSVDPFCHVSHLSAMQRYGLTNRRPKSLFLTTPAPKTARTLTADRMMRDHGEDIGTRLDDIVPLKVVHHPKSVRKREISDFRTAHPGQWLPVRGSLARLATIGQTFTDTLTEPGRCGGMAHVIEVWREFGPTYLEEIVSAIDVAPTAIAKVRAGYILSELLGIDDPRVTAWQRFAMRGGSRVLDPSKPYAPEFSETWMLSTNV